MKENTTQMPSHLYFPDTALGGFWDAYRVKIMQDYFLFLCKKE